MEPVFIVYMDVVSKAKTQSEEMVLAARNNIEINVTPNKNQVFVFLLEYTLCETSSSLSKPIQFDCIVKWGVLTFDKIAALFDQNDLKINLDLILSQGHFEKLHFTKDLEQALIRLTCPNGNLCFKNDINIELSFSVRNDKNVVNQQDEHEEVSIKKQIYDTSVEREQVISYESTPVSLSPRRKTSIPKQNDPKLDQGSARKSMTNAELVPMGSNDLTLTDPVQMRSQMNLYQQMMLQALCQQAAYLPYVPFNRPYFATGPYLGGMGPNMYETLEPNMVPPYLATKYVDPNPLTIGSSGSMRSEGLSRAMCAKLNSAGFTPMCTETGELPFSIDPNSDTIENKFSLTKEQNDPLIINEIVIQFLIYSNTKSNMADMESQNCIQALDQIFFTFQFYRFAPVRTPVLTLGKNLEHFGSQSQFQILWLTKCRGTQLIDETSKPGYEMTFQLNPNYFKPGEFVSFMDYLQRAHLHVDVWNAKSHMLIGACMVSLKGKHAVQMTYTLDVLQTPTNEFLQDEGAASLDEHPVVQGQVIMRLANIGRHSNSDEGRELILTNRHRKLHVIGADQKGIYGSFKGGSLFDATLAGKENMEHSTRIVNRPELNQTTVRARLIRSENNELKQLLANQQLDYSELCSYDNNNNNNNNNNGDGGGDCDDGLIRRQKLNRLHLCLKAAKGSSGLRQLMNSTMTNTKKTMLNTRAMQMDLINHYRKQKKQELIRSLLDDIQTVDHHLYTSFGCTEFFEFELKNALESEDTIQIKVEDDSRSLRIVTDSREVRALKLAFDIQSPTEDELFDIRSDQSLPSSNPTNLTQLRVFVKPKETVLIPIKYMESTIVQCANSGLTKSNNVQSSENFNQYNRTIQVHFVSIKSNKSISKLVLHIHVQPPIVDQSFRFFHPELSYLKKLIRIPPCPTKSNPNFQSMSQVWTRVSDSEVLALSNTVRHGEIIDLLVKVSLGKSPQILNFLIAVYMDPYQIQPAYIWSWAVHALQRIDSVAYVGQLSSPIGLVLRVDEFGGLHQSGVKHVAIYPSDPNEIIVGTQLDHLKSSNDDVKLTLSPLSVYEVKLKIRPKKVGQHAYQINVIDTDYQVLLRSWIVCVDCKEPEITKTFNIQLPQFDYTDACNKRIAYTNSYSHHITLQLETNRPDLVQFKERIIEIASGSTAQLGLCFNPQNHHRDCEKFYIFIKDQFDKNLETFCIVANYCLQK